MNCIFFKNNKKNPEEEAKKAGIKLLAAEERLKQAKLAKKELRKALFESPSYKACPYLGHLYIHQEKKILRKQIAKARNELPALKKMLKKEVCYAKDPAEEALALANLKNAKCEVNKAKAEYQEASKTFIDGLLNYKKICKQLKPFEKEVEASERACAKARKDFEKKRMKVADWMLHQGNHSTDRNGSFLKECFKV